MIVKINGEIVTNEIRNIIDALIAWEVPVVGEYFAPKDMEKAIQNLPAGERLEVKINSDGGIVSAGQEIYTMLRARNDVNIEIESRAASAASIIAMAGHSSISPIGMIMIHDTSVSGVDGNKQDMRHMANILAEHDKALANAYAEKTGKDVNDILSLMDKETWLTAQRAVELGFVDEITGTVQQAVMNSASDMSGKYKALMETYEKVKGEREQQEKVKNDLLKDLDNYGI